MDAVIVSAVRTPLGKYNGSLAKFTAMDLGALAIKEALNRAQADPNEVEEVIMGHVLQAGQGQNPARQASIAAGVTVSAGAMTINKVCGSGMKSAIIAANAIRLGQHKVMVAGGMESMTNAPYYLYKARFGYKMGNAEMVDGMVHDGLWDKYNNFHMGLTGEVVAEKWGITREDADKLALRSHKLASEALSSGKFADEMLPIEIPQRKKDPIVFQHDEGVRPDSTMESLGKLRPAFKPDGGIVTAGNASQLSDGACALVLMPEDEAQKRGLTPLAKIVDYNTSGMEPKHVMSAPIPSVKELMERNNLTVGDIDLFEHNEAFASASCAVMKEVGIPDEKFNVNGGAVAMGHPIGASGARILTTLIYALKDRNAHRGLATICLGGGNAVSMLVERP